MNIDEYYKDRDRIKPDSDALKKCSFQRELVKDKLSFVVPFARAKSTEGHYNDADNSYDASESTRLKTMILSLIKQFNIEDLCEFFVITPPKDIHHAEEILRSITNDERFKVRSELDLCPEFNMFNVLKSSKISDLCQNLKFLYRYKKRLKKVKAKGRIGWQKQQLVKLAAHNLIRSTNYMTLDADVVCIRKFSLKDVILQGKALTQVEQIGDYVDLYHPLYAAIEYQVKAKRYFHAFKMLQFDRPAEYKYRIYSETPVIMNTKGVSMMTQYIENKFESGWRKYLLKNFDSWTEYPLYFLFLEGTDLFDQMYSVTPENKLWDISKSLWQKDYYYREKRALDNIEEYLNDVKGYFIVLQTGWGVRSGNFFEKIAKKIREL